MLGVALIVSVIAAAAMQIARLETRSAVADEEQMRARIIAQSAVAFVLGRMEEYSNWRDLYTEGVEEPSGSWINLNSTGKLKFVLLDSDGDLADDTSDPVIVKGIGRAGSTTSVVTALLQPTGQGLSCLAASLHAEGDILNSSNFDCTTNQQISSNSNISFQGGSGQLVGNAWAVGTIEPVGDIQGTNSPGNSTPREMPDPDTVLDYYLANGTVIRYADLVPSGKIDKVVLSPGNNPFGTGATNAQGIYIIDCQGNILTIQNSRLEATLVLLNTGGGTEVRKDIHWEPAIANYPALLSQGDVHLFEHAEHVLREAQLNVNFNPPGSPYQTVEDTDKIDEYANIMKGLFYVQGDLCIEKLAVFEGVFVVEGNFVVKKSVVLTYDATLINNPPPGFTDGTKMKVTPGTWQQAEY